MTRAAVRFAAILSLALALVGAAQAQTPPVVPTPSELGLRGEPPKTDAQNLPLQEATPRARAKPESDITLDVRAYALPASAPAALREALARITQPYVGPARHYEDLFNAAADVARYLQRDLGYYLGYAYLPEQDPADGIVQIAVLEGRLDEVQIEWSDDIPVRRDVIEGYLAALKPGSVLQVDTIERVVFLINDLRGVSASFQVREGRRSGYATLVVTARAAPRWTERVDLDNGNSRFLGPYRVGAQLGWNSPTGRGDVAALNAIRSTNGGLLFGFVNYTTPIGHDGLRLGASLASIDYKLGEGFSGKGSSLSSSAYAIYPILRSRNLNLFSGVTLEHKKFSDVTPSADRTSSSTHRTFSSTHHAVSSVAATLSGDVRDAWAGGAISTFEGTLSGGQVHDGAHPSDPSIAARRYKKLNYGATRLQNLVPQKWLLYGALRGQWAFDNLDSTEQFRVGGPDGVRAFASGEGSGDSGAIGIVELRTIPPVEWFGRAARELIFGVFYDRGIYQSRHSGGASGNSGTYAGAGVMALWTRPDDFSMQLNLAKPTHGTPKADTQTRNPRLTFRLSKSF